MLIDLNPYLEFIDSKKNFVYDSNLILHRHHIIPRHFFSRIELVDDVILELMNKYDLNMNDPSNLISLSIDDHYTAHWILSNCFDEDDIFYVLNSLSCAKIASCIRDVQSMKLSLKRSWTPSRKKQQSELVKKIFTGKKRPPNTNEQKKKISESLKKRYEVIPFHLKGITLSDERKQQIRESMIGEGNPMYGKVGELSPNWGRIHTDETKEKISKSQKGRIITEEHRENMKNSQRIRDPKSRFSKKCIILNQEYENATHASEILNIPINKIRFRCKSTKDVWKDWRYLSNGE